MTDWTFEEHHSYQAMSWKMSPRLLRRHKHHNTLMEKNWQTGKFPKLYSHVKAIRTSTTQHGTSGHTRDVGEKLVQQRVHPTREGCPCSYFVMPWELGGYMVEL